MHSTINLIVVLAVVATCVEYVAGGCRMQERNPCETVCQWNVERRDYDCVLRAVVILPKTDEIEASLPRVFFYCHQFHVCARRQFFVFIFVCVLCGDM